MNINDKLQKKLFHKIFFKKKLIQSQNNLLYLPQPLV